MTIFIIKATPKGDSLYAGTVRLTAHGFRFITQMPGRLGSRKDHPTLQAAIPDWAGPGYIVKADSLDAALKLVAGYRDGVAWANTAALAGDIDTFR